jgi:hypothetical protein
LKITSKRSESSPISDTGRFCAVVTIRVAWGHTKQGKEDTHTHTRTHTHAINTKAYMDRVELAAGQCARDQSQFIGKRFIFDGAVEIQREAHCIIVIIWRP